MATLNNLEEVQSFSIEDQSDKPYAWMLENVDIQDVLNQGIPQYVEAHVKQTIASINFSDVSDSEVYRTWLESGELNACIQYMVGVAIEYYRAKIETLESELSNIKLIIK